jgi:hypothetical protein
VAPVANADIFALLHGTTVTLFVLSSDTGANNNINPASVVIVQQPTQGIATVNADGSVTCVSTASSSGSDSFTHTVMDLTGLLSNVTMVTLNLS